MRVYASEIKKIWNWKTVFAIAVVVLLAYVFRFNWYVRSYNGARGIFGDYLQELWDKYGDTLDANEYADFDFEGRKSGLIKQINEMIRSSTVCAKYGIENYDDYIRVIRSFWQDYGTEDENGERHLPDERNTDRLAMMEEIESPYGREPFWQTDDVRRV